MFVCVYVHVCVHVFVWVLVCGYAPNPPYNLISAKLQGQNPTSLTAYVDPHAL